MKIEETPIDGVLLITPKLIRDERGYFCETFRQDVFDGLHAGVAFVQDNQALSVDAGVVRGLHFQSPPFAQAKLVRVLRGSILDVAVDIRRGSPTYGRYVAVELSSSNMKQLYVPEGFSHGYLTLESNVEVAYKVSSRYAPAHDHGVYWADPDISVSWPIEKAKAILSPKDAALPLLHEIESPFVYAS